MLSPITRFLNDEEGATAIEYGIIAGLVAVAIVASLSGDNGLAPKLSGLFDLIAGKFAAIS